jgi:uncharacterized protein YjbI with pentapeptide repeats
MHFWNFKIKLPNTALTAPIVGALIILALGIYFVVVGFQILHPDQPINFHTLLPDFYSNAATTLIGTAFTVLIIDWLNRIRDNRLEKIRLLRDIGCGDHGIALRAILDVTANNLHQKGFLSYRIFENAKLAGAMLIGADLSHSSFYFSDFTGVELPGANLHMTSFWGGTLRGVDLRDADLSESYFEYVDFTDARVTPKQLQSTNRLHGSRLPNGKIYDGRFNLPVDIQDAQASGIDVNDPNAMAKWYQMPYEQYMRSMDLRKEKPEIDDWKNW